MKNTAIPVKLIFAGLIASVLFLSRPALAAAPPPVTGNLQKFFIDGGVLVWILLLLSFLTIKLIVQYFLTVRRSRLLPPPTLKGVEKLLAASDHPAALDFLSRDRSLIAATVHAGLIEVPHGSGAVRMAVAESLEQDTANLLRKIEWLNLIGNVAPMIGLFGTVWGMIEAFNGIVQAGGQPQPADLAAGISVALVTTWWGLIVAIPALAAFGFLRNRIDSLTAEVLLTSEKLLADKAMEK